MDSSSCKTRSKSSKNAYSTSNPSNTGKADTDWLALGLPFARPSYETWCKVETDPRAALERAQRRHYPGLTNSSIVHLKYTQQLFQPRDYQLDYMRPHMERRHFPRLATLSQLDDFF